MRKRCQGKFANLRYPLRSVRRCCSAPPASRLKITLAPPMGPPEASLTETSRTAPVWALKHSTHKNVATGKRNSITSTLTIHLTVVNVNGNLGSQARFIQSCAGLIRRLPNRHLVEGVPAGGEGRGAGFEAVGFEDVAEDVGVGLNGQSAGLCRGHRLLRPVIECFD